RSTGGVGFPRHGDPPCPRPRRRDSHRDPRPARGGRDLDARCCHLGGSHRVRGGRERNGRGTIGGGIPGCCSGEHRRSAEPGASMKALGIMAAFLRRDWVIETSYRATFALEFLSTVFILALFFYLSQVVDEAQFSAHQDLSSGYFG